MRLDARMLAQPPEVSRGGEWPVLTLEQMVVLCQALGLALDQDSARFSVGEVGGQVILRADGEPVFLLPRAAWRQRLSAWRPTHFLPRSE